MKTKMLRTILPLGALAASLTASADSVIWVDWTSGTAGAAGSAVGTIDTGSEIIDVSYTGEIQFIQTAGGPNYWAPSAPYMSALVDNAPPASDIIALSRTTQKTLTFSKPIDNLFLAVVSLNGNGWIFNEDFEVVSYGHGYWGNGTLTREDLGGGQYRTSGTGEPHGVIRFNKAVSSISWTSQNNENWNGFTVGTYGAARVPDAGSSLLLLGGSLGALAMARSLRRR